MVKPKERNKKNCLFCFFYEEKVISLIKIFPNIFDIISWNISCKIWIKKKTLIQPLVLVYNIIFYHIFSLSLSFKFSIFFFIFLILEIAVDTIEVLSNIYICSSNNGTEEMGAPTENNWEEISLFPTKKNDDGRYVRLFSCCYCFGIFGKTWIRNRDYVQDIEDDKDAMSLFLAWFSSSSSAAAEWEEKFGVVWKRIKEKKRWTLFFFSLSL